MASAAVSLLAGAVFGLALAAPPGPMNAVIAEESVLRGWLAGFLAGLGAMTADATFFVLAVAGVVGFVTTLPTLRTAMVGAGGVLMLHFAYGALREARSFTAPAAGAGGESRRESRGFAKAFVLAITNPYQIVFWLTVGIGLLDPGTVDVVAHLPVAGDALAGRVVIRTGSPALVVGFFLGIAGWIVAFPASLVVAGGRIDRFATAVAALSAVVLALYGIVFLADAVGSLA